MTKTLAFRAHGLEQDELIVVGLLLCSTYLEDVSLNFSSEDAKSPRATNKHASRILRHPRRELPPLQNPCQALTTR